MKYGFDLDGTLDRPVLADLARQLHEGGHEVHIITCAYLGVAGYKATKATKEKKLRALGVPYTKLHLVSGHNYSDVGDAKAAIINAEGIPIMFDDSPTFCTRMKRLSPAVILRVEEPRDESGSGT